MAVLQVQGIAQDKKGKTVATLFGKWDESMHYVNGECSGKGKAFESLSYSHMLWRKSRPPKFPTRYNFTRFAITLNEITPGLKVIIEVIFYQLNYCILQYIVILILGFIVMCRKGCLQRIQGLGLIKDTWKTVNLKWRTQRKYG